MNMGYYDLSLARYTNSKDNMTRFQATFVGISYVCACVRVCFKNKFAYVVIYA